MVDVVFGRAKRPTILDLPVEKPYDGAGFTRVAPRQIVGVCEHITAGRGTPKWYQGFFGTGGQRALDALVDLMISRAGEIAQFNDPWGTRSPWANGKLDGLQGDGPAYLAKFGVNGVNDRLASTEHEGTATEDWTQALWDAAVELDVWLFDKIGVRFDSFPVHQAYGVVVHLLHGEFTGKGGNTEEECPGRYLHRNIDRYQHDVVIGLKEAQAPDAQVEPKPPGKPGPLYPKGLSADIVSGFFGHIRKHEADGKIKEQGYNDKGVVSLAYLARAGKEQKFPAAGDWFTFRTGDVDRDLITFSNGWVLFRDQGRAGWRWLDEAA